MKLNKNMKIIKTKNKLYRIKRNKIIFIYLFIFIIIIFYFFYLFFFYLYLLPTELDLKIFHPNN